MNALKALIFALIWVASGATPASAQTTQEKLGHPATARLLIIHADDLGMNHSTNRATFEALEKGWVQSASILVVAPWFPEVVRWAKAHPDADLGIHMALNSEWTDFRWGPVSATSDVPSLLDQEGYLPLLETMLPGRARIAEAEVELRAQVERARAMGIRISHLDSHMTGLLQSPDLIGLYRKMGQAYNLPTLIERTSGAPRSGGMEVPEALIDRVIAINPGVPYEKDKWLEAYKNLLRPLGPGVYELIVHTAYDDEEMRGATWNHPDWGSKWRQLDFDLVKSKEFQQFIRDQGFILIKWRDLAKALPNAAPQAATTR